MAKKNRGTTIPVGGPVRVVGLTVVKCITKIQKGPKIKCRIIRVVELTMVGITVFYCTQDQHSRSCARNILKPFLKEKIRLTTETC